MPSAGLNEDAHQSWVFSRPECNPSGCPPIQSQAQGACGCRGSMLQPGRTRMLIKGRSQNRGAVPCWLLLACIGAPLQAQANHDDYDEVDPWIGVAPALAGPDSAAVAGFLAALSDSDPVVCQLAVGSVGNNWS